MITVIPTYCRILGIELDFSQGRDQLVKEIIAALGPNCTMYDLDALKYHSLDESSPLGMWLANNRQDVTQGSSSAITVFKDYYLANITHHRDGADEYALVKIGFVIGLTTYGNVPPSAETVPVLNVSRQRRTKQVWQILKRETADLTEETLLWVLSPDRLTQLNLPAMKVTLKISSD